MSAKRTAAAANLVQLAGRGAWIRLVALSILCAASEGFGFVLLVPLLARLDGGASDLPFGLEMPDLPLEGLLAAFVVLVALRALAEVARQLAAQDVQAAVVDGLRLNATRALLDARWRWLSQVERATSEALLITTMDRAGYAAELLASLVRLSLALAALALAALVLSPSAALVGAAAGMLMLLAFIPLLRRARRLGEALTKANAALYAKLGAMLASLRIIKSFGREAGTGHDVADSLRTLRRRERAFVRDSAVTQAALQIAGAGLATLMAWLALDALAMPVALLIPLAAIVVRALPLIGQAQSTAQNWFHARPAIDEALALIATAEAQREPGILSGRTGPQASIPEPPQLRHALSLRDVSVDLAGKRPALRDISLDIAARRMLVVTGPSGAGKSTLADVAAGLLFPLHGHIAIDDTVMDEQALRTWRGRVAYVPQVPLLVSGSVRDNLAWAAPDADRDAMARALDEAGAAFVHNLPGGIDCDLGEDARALSGGERQRIALARALLRDPAMIVLDEATSALDSAGEQAIAAALHALAERTTVLAVAHRGILLEVADRVVRMDMGRIVQA